MLIRLSQILAIIVSVIIEITLTKGSNIHIHHAGSHAKINLVAEGTPRVANVLRAVIIVTAIIPIVPIITVVVIIVASTAAAATFLRAGLLLFVLGCLLEQEFSKTGHEHCLEKHFFPWPIRAHPGGSRLLHLERSQVLVSLRQPEQTGLAEVAQVLDHPILHLVTIFDPL